MPSSSVSSVENEKNHEGLICFCPIGCFEQPHSSCVEIVIMYLTSLYSPSSSRYSSYSVLLLVVLASSTTSS